LQLYYQTLVKIKMMQHITSVAELRNAIQTAEIEQAHHCKMLKDQFFLTYESLKPVSLITSTLASISKSPFLIDNIMGTVMGLATGYLSRTLFIGSSVNRIRRLIGTILQFGITNVIAQNSDTITSFGKSLFRNIFHKKV